MRQFIYDMIHMTEGEKFIAYWWLWLIIVIVCSIAIYTYSKIGSFHFGKYH